MEVNPGAPTGETSTNLSRALNQQGRQVSRLSFTFSKIYVAKLTVWVYACIWVRVRAHACMHMCVHVCVCALVKAGMHTCFICGGQRSVSGVISQEPSTLFLK